MKHLLLLCFFLLSSQLSHSQTFLEDYYEAKRPNWEKEITEEMISQVDPKMDSMFRAVTGKGWLETQMGNEKKATEQKIEVMKQILNLATELNTSKQLYLVEESVQMPPTNFSRTGFVKGEGTTTFFIYDFSKPDTVYTSADFLSGSITEQQSKAREIILNLIEKNDLKRLVELAKMEVSLSEQNPELRPSYEYEVIYYNPERKKKIESIYLHEWIVNLK